MQWVLRDLMSDQRVRLQLIVAGAHYSRRQGLTFRSILRDGFRPVAQIRSWAAEDEEQIASTIGRMTVGFAHAFRRLRPDILLLLGDRSELLAAASAATVFRIPIAHLHGGETTLGATDEAVRNAVTKLSHLHLVSADAHGDVVRHLGEEARRIRVVGAPGLDHLKRTRLPSPQSVLEGLTIPVSDERPLFLVTFHPATLEPGAAEAATKNLLRAIAHFSARVVITAPNTDPEHERIYKLLRKFHSRGTLVRFVATLGAPAYLSVLKVADVVIGNSSSGLIEAPSFGTPVVDIGSRQRGRLRAANVIHVAADAESIRKGIARALTPPFVRAAQKARNPYYRAGSSKRIARILASIPLDGRLLRKNAVVEPGEK
jgi:UDP-hydrolysing UDP-N-acetyl-D-glucosamine 2-epimerase